MHHHKLAILIGGVLGAGFALQATPVRADVAIDRIPNVATISATYPDGLVFVRESAEMILNAYALVDVAAPTHEYKGQVQGAGYGATLVEGRKQPQLYVAETHHDRGSRGTRTDMVTIYDKASLNPVAEIILPGGKRGLMGGGLGRMQLTADERFALVFNFTPGSSVTVVDLAQRRVINEVPVPGCTLIYPNGERGFFTLCANGALVSFTLSETGQVLNEHRSEVFNEIDKDVLYSEATRIGGVNYFASQLGNIRPIRSDTEKPEILPTWPLMSRDEYAQGWRTKDGTFVASDAAGRLYVRVQQAAKTKSRKARTEVWVFDVAAQKRLARIALKNGAGSIQVTRGAQPYLAVVSEVEPAEDGRLDIYDARSGRYSRSIGGWSPGVYLSLIQARP